MFFTGSMSGPEHTQGLRSRERHGGALSASTWSPSSFHTLSRTQELFDMKHLKLNPKAKTSILNFIAYHVHSGFGKNKKHESRNALDSSQPSPKFQSLHPVNQAQDLVKLTFG